MNFLFWRRRRPILANASVAKLLGRLRLAASHLFSLEVLVQQKKGGLIGLGCSHDSKHPLACVIMRRLCFSVSYVTTKCMYFYARNRVAEPGVRSVLHCLEIEHTLAIEMRAPDVLRISLILLPARPMMQPTMSAGMLMF